MNFVEVGLASLHESTNLYKELLNPQLKRRHIFTKAIRSTYLLVHAIACGILSSQIEYEDDEPDNTSDDEQSVVVDNVVTAVQETDKENSVGQYL